MTMFHIRAWPTGQIPHTVEIAKETPLYAPDLRGISLENVQPDGADLRHANLSGVSLRGAVCVGPYWTTPISAAPISVIRSFQAQLCAKQT